MHPFRRFGGTVKELPYLILKLLFMPHFPRLYANVKDGKGGHTSCSFPGTICKNKKQCPKIGSLRNSIDNFVLHSEVVMTVKKRVLRNPALLLIVGWKRIASCNIGKANRLDKPEIHFSFSRRLKWDMNVEQYWFVIPKLIKPKALKRLKA